MIKPEFSDIEEILMRSLNSTISKKDLEKLSRWRQLSPKNELLMGTLNEKSMEPQHPHYESLEKRIIDAGFRESDTLIKPSTSRYQFYKVAATIALICITSWAVIKTATKQEVTERQQELVVSSNPTGQRSKISLPDRTVIWLNSESKLTYKKGFTDSVRFIKLEGEAYFEVEPDLNRPFVVETGIVRTTVLGTSFNIRNFPEENSISVALITGKVRVTDSKADNELFLEPFEQIKFSKNTGSFKMTQFNEDIISIWKDGIICFKESSFKQVIQTLERSYDVDFDYNNYNLRNWNYTGKFENISLEIVLTRIGYSEGFSFEIDGRKVKIQEEPKI